MIRALLAIALVACHAAPAPTPRGPRVELLTAVAVDGGVVAVTRAGTLARYDHALGFVAEASAPSPVVAINGDLAALANGDIVRIDRALAVERIGHVDGTARWLGTRGDSVIVFVDRDGTLALDVLGGESIAVPYDWTTTRMKGHPSSFLRDGDTLWWGIDAGEWGGAVGRVDLATGAVSAIRTDPVYGFVKHGDRVLVYGGLAHDGSAHATIGVVENDAVREVYRRPSSRRYRPKNPPGAPIAHMLVAGPRLYALVWRELYEVSADFTQWKKLATLPARARAGRPDAMGNYPATVAMFAVGDAIVFATTQDGLFVWRGGQLARVTP